MTDKLAIWLSGGSLLVSLASFGLAAMAKRLATDTGFDVVNGCLQIHGGYGYLRDHPIERVLRDLRVHQILEGTNEVMRLIVSRDLLGN